MLKFKERFHKASVDFNATNRPYTREEDGLALCLLSLVFKYPTAAILGAVAFIVNDTLAMDPDIYAEHMRGIQEQEQSEVQQMNVRLDYYVTVLAETNTKIAQFHASRGLLSPS